MLIGIHNHGFQANSNRAALEIKRCHIFTARSRKAIFIRMGTDELPRVQANRI